MKLIVEIADDKAELAIEVLKSLDLVKKAKPISNAATQLWEELSESAKEVTLHKEGKIKLKSAEDLIQEL
jgi:hypothetical protein